MLSHIEQNENGLDAFSQGYQNYGLHVTNKGLMFREWIPAATDVFVYGDFSRFK